MLNLVIFGGPGSGKGTQSVRIASHYGIRHISTGELLRRHIAEGDELGLLANSFISKGQLIPDEVMLRVVEDVLDANAEACANGVIFDGFPRTLGQAEVLKTFLASRGTKVHAVIGLEVADEELIRRMILRGQQTGRADDIEDIIKNRLEVYHSVTTPLREYYMGEGIYLAIKGDGSIDEIFGNICKALDKRLSDTQP